MTVHTKEKLAELDAIAASRPMAQAAPVAPAITLESLAARVTALEKRFGQFGNVWAIEGEAAAPAQAGTDGQDSPAETEPEGAAAQSQNQEQSNG